MNLKIKNFELAKIENINSQLSLSILLAKFNI